MDNSWTLDAHAADQAAKLSEIEPALDTERQAAFPEKLPSRPAPWGYSRTIHGLYFIVFIALAVSESVLTFTVPVDVGFDKEVSSDPFQIAKVTKSAVNSLPWNGTLTDSMRHRGILTTKGLFMI